MRAKFTNGLLPGEKGFCIFEVELPDGWYRVLSGAVMPGDQYINSCLFWSDGLVEWLDVKIPSGNSWLVRKVDNKVASFDCVIRRGDPVEELCPICLDAPVALGWKYCKACAWEKVQEMRKTGR